jgi:hypothetical protein
VSEANKELLAEWYRKRVEGVHARVTAFDVLQRNGVSFKQAGSDRAEQFSCPFHGADAKPSARVFPADANSHSHAWCYVCQERWDAISLWQKYTGTTKFSQALSEIERTFGLQTPEMPQGISEESPQQSKHQDEFDAMYAICERRLKEAKYAFEMKPFLILATALDRLRARADAGQLSWEEGLETLRKILDKIGAVVRACPGG